MFLSLKILSKLGNRIISLLEKDTINKTDVEKSILGRQTRKSHWGKM